MLGPWEFPTSPSGIALEMLDDPMEPREVAGSSALWRRWLVLLRWILLSRMQVETCCSVPLQNGSFHDRIGTRWDMLKPDSIVMQVLLRQSLWGQLSLIIV